MEDDDYVTSTQAAKMLNVSTATVRAWCGKGYFPRAYLDTTNPLVISIWMIPVRDLEKFKPPKMGRPSKKVGNKV
jgi:hypothetical protein